MTIQVGDKVPLVNFKKMTNEGPKEINSEAVFNGKKVVFFAVPGAFTPGCSVTHLPGFVVKADEIKSKGVDEIVCMAVNDAFVMGAWGQAQNAEELLMLADGNGHFTKQIGLDMNTSNFGGLRSLRYSMLIEDGEVKKINVEDPGRFDVSDAQSMLDSL